MSEATSLSRPFAGRVTDVDVLLNETRPQYEAALATTRPALPLGTRKRIENLCVVRESDSNDYLDAEGLVAQLANLFPELPGIHAVARAGSAPLRLKKPGFIVIVDIDPSTGEEVEHRTQVDLLSHGETKVALFSYLDVTYMYSLASAAKVDDLGNQEWTDLFMALLALLRPKNVRTVHMSRFVRNQDVAGSLLNAMAFNVEKVWLGSIPLEMQGLRAPMDKLLFIMLAMAAALERNALVERNYAGKLNRVRNGVWIHGERSLPLGYKLGPNHELLPDPSQKQRVRELLLLVCERPTPKEFVKRLGRLGVTMPAVPARQLDERSVAFTASPDSKWQSVLSHLPLYATGEHIVHAHNPYPGVEEVAGLAVVSRKNKRGESTSEIQVVMKPGVPPGGWAEPALIDAALAVAIDFSNHRHAQVGDAPGQYTFAGESDARRGARMLPAATTAQLTQPAVHIGVMSRGAMRVTKPSAKRSLPWAGTAWETQRHGHTWELASRGGSSYVLIRHHRSSMPDGDDLARRAGSGQPTDNTDGAR